MNDDDGSKVNKDWLKYLREDERELLGRVLTGKAAAVVLMRLAWERACMDRLTEMLDQDRPPAPTEDSSSEVRWEQIKADPKFWESERLREECDARGGCTFKIVDETREWPLLRCDHCGSSVLWHQQPIRMPVEDEAAAMRELAEPRLKRAREGCEVLEAAQCFIDEYKSSTNTSGR